MCAQIFAQLIIVALITTKIIFATITIDGFEILKGQSNICAFDGQIYHANRTFKALNVTFLCRESLNNSKISISAYRWLSNRYVFFAPLQFTANLNGFISAKNQDIARLVHECSNPQIAPFIKPNVTYNIFNWYLKACPESIPEGNWRFVAELILDEKNAILSTFHYYFTMINC